MNTVIFDGNIYDLLANDRAAVEKINTLIAAGSLKVVITRTIVEELLKSPFGGVPTFFPTNYTGNTVGRCGLAACGDSIGSGEVFDAHKGNSKKVKDALIADAANWKAQWLVSNDKRLQSRAKKLSLRCKAFNYAEFKNAIGLSGQDC